LAPIGDAIKDSDRELDRLRPDDDAAYVNFYQYLRLLAYWLQRGGSETLTIEELKPLAQDAAIVSLAWRAATAQPLQPRVIGDMREQRVWLSKQLPQGVELTLPAWWPPDPVAGKTGEESAAGPSGEPAG
jgi:hypothetical protein